MNNQENWEYIDKDMYINKYFCCRGLVFSLSTEICATGVLVHLFFYWDWYSRVPSSLAMIEQRVLAKYSAAKPRDMAKK